MPSPLITARSCSAVTPSVNSSFNESCLKRACPDLIVTGFDRGEDLAFGFVNTCGTTVMTTSFLSCKIFVFDSTTAPVELPETFSLLKDTGASVWATSLF